MAPGTYRSYTNGLKVNQSQIMQKVENCGPNTRQSLNFNQNSKQLLIIIKFAMMKGQHKWSSFLLRRQLQQELWKELKLKHQRTQTSGASSWHPGLMTSAKQQKNNIWRQSISMGGTVRSQRRQQAAIGGRAWRAGGSFLGNYQIY